VNSDTMPRCMISKERMMHGVKSVPASCANPDTAWCRICQGPATEYPLYRLNCQCQGPENLVHQACLISTLNDSRFDPTCCYVCQCKWTMNRPLCSFYQ
jgi:E3 ubiquitin-protein ligase DOA10